MKEDYDDYVLVECLEDEVLKQRLLAEGFKKIPLVSIIPAVVNGATVYRVDKIELPDRAKEIIIERVAEKNNITKEEAERLLDKNDWFIRASGVGTKNIFKYIL
jgi:dephospho-CoA kinase